MTSRRSLQSLASKVRRSMEKVYGSPRGECYRWSNYVACEVLELAPSQKVWLATGELVLGSLSLSHSWVEVGEWVVDITADQFNKLAGVRMPVAWVLPSSAKNLRHQPRHRRLVHPI